MKQYDHMFDIAFSVKTNISDPDALSSADLVTALLRRIADLVYDGEMIEACGHCDSYKEEDRKKA